MEGGGEEAHLEGRLALDLLADRVGQALVELRAWKEGQSQSKATPPPPYQHQKGEREREGRTDLAEDAHGELGGDLACLDEVVERVGQGESDAGGRRLVSV